jgi:hypothetical protein
VTGGHLLAVVCGAGPATDVDRLITAAHACSWTVAVTATSSAEPFIDTPAIEQLTGSPVRTDYQMPTTGRRKPPAIDAMIIAPATYNSINKLAAGIADTYALTSAAELIGRGIPTVVVPFVNAALAARAPFRRAIGSLRDEGVRVLSGPDDRWVPYPPGGGAEARKTFPWQAALRMVDEVMMHRR